MASKIPDFRFVRCPKCLKLLAEVPGIPLYKCGGCGTTLRAKVHSNGGVSVDLASAASTSKNISESYSLDHGTETNAKAIPAASDEHGELDQAVKSCSYVEENSKEELFTNKQQTPAVTASDANTESNQEKEESALLEQQEHSMLKERKPSNVAVTKDLGLDSLNLSDKLEVSPEIVEHESTSDDDMKNGKLRLRSTSSRAYEGNLSSTDEERMHRIPQKYLLLSKRTFRSRRSSDSDESIREAGEDSMKKIADPIEQLTDRNHPWKHSNGGLQQLVSTGNVDFVNGKETGKQDTSFASEDFLSVQNWTEPEKEASFVPQTKDNKLFEARNSKKDDHAKILRKVDELKDELHGFFNKVAHVGEKGGTFTGRVLPKEYRSSSLVPYPNQPISSSCALCHPERSPCCHNAHCRPCPHNVCCRHWEAAGSPEPRTLSPQQNDKKPPTMKRHCRPICGGAPFVVCYRCYKLLQLPTDFLLSAKLIHRLRCGHCGQVLKYSFRPRPRSAPRSPSEVRLPPSEDEEERNGENPVSYSEEYEMSCAKSNSYEAETSLRMEKNREGMVEKEKEDYCRLHRLMGYPSAQQLLFEKIKADGGRRTGQSRYV